MRTIAAAAVIAGAVAMSAGVSAQEPVGCVLEGGVSGWIYSSEAGQVSLGHLTVAPGWDATVRVSVENNVGDIDQPYHTATVAVGGQSFPVERDGQGRFYSFDVAATSDADLTLSTTDGWSAAYSAVVVGCSEVPAVETTPPPPDEPTAPAPTVPAPAAAPAEVPAVTPAAPLASLPVTGVGTWVIAGVGAVMAAAGAGLTRWAAV